MTGFARVDFDTVAPLMPFDKTAGQVAARGESFEWSPSPGNIHSTDPIAHRPPIREEQANPEFINLTGARTGRLTVLGVAAEIPSNGNGQRWVVRCVCGAYETRKAKSIKAALSGDWKADHEPMCGWCCNNRRLQRGGFDKRKAAAAAQAIQELAR